MTKLKRKRVVLVILSVVFIVSEWGELSVDSLLRLATVLVGL
jgi:hypothetical protein